MFSTYISNFRNIRNYLTDEYEFTSTTLVTIYNRPNIDCQCNVLITMERYRKHFALKTHQNIYPTQKSFIIIVLSLFLNISALISINLN